MAAVGAQFGARIRTIRLGFGPELVRVSLLGFDVAFGPLPFGGYVQFWRTDDEEQPLEGMPYFDELPGYRRALTQLAGPLSLFLLACIVTLSIAWRPVVSGWIDYVSGALAPRTRGVSLLVEAMTAIRTQPALSLLGLICAKLAAWNLLPIPSLNGGSAIVDLCLPSDEGGKRIAGLLSVVGMLILMAASIAWFVALWIFFWQ